MAILNLASFYDLLVFSNYSFELNENTISSVDGSGQVLTSHLGPRIWGGMITCSAAAHADAIRLNTLMQTIQNPNVFFEITDELRQNPLTYKAADSAGLNAVKLANPVVGYSASLTGLPASYVLSAGDNFSVTLNGVNRLFRIAVGGTATAAGALTVTLLNPLPSGLANNAAVTLKRPSLTARLVPGSLNTYSYGLSVGAGASFTWVQTLRI